jgi:hypothetical protein
MITTDMWRSPTTMADHNGTRREPIPADAPVAQSQVSDYPDGRGVFCKQGITAADLANAVANNGAGWRWMPTKPEGSRPGHEDLSGPPGTALILLRIRRLGVRVPPSAPHSSQVKTLGSAESDSSSSSSGRISYPSRVVEAVCVAVHFARVEMPVPVQRGRDAGMPRAEGQAR